MTQERVETCCPNSELCTKYKVCLTDKNDIIEQEYDIFYGILF